MIQEAVLGIVLLSNVSLIPVDSIKVPSAYLVSPRLAVATKELDLETRLPDKGGAQIFADNILYSLHYLKGDTDSFKEKGDVDWEKVRKLFDVSFVLKPGESFAFHKNILPEFKDSVVYTMNSRFFTDEGYKSLGGLGGNGVCHLASLINWTASTAGLEVVSKVNHDFYPVPGVPKEYGTSIFYAENGGNSQNQNLYIKNNFEVPVYFEFKADNKKIVLKISR